MMASCGSADDPESASRAGVGVIAEGCGLTATSGSGVTLGDKGQVVTVAHTLRGATDVIVIDADNVEHQARVVAFDKDADLAVLRAVTLNTPALQLGPVATGSGSALVWSRDEMVRRFELNITKRLDVMIEDIYGDGRVKRSALEVTADIEVGDSGGPILNTSDQVVGIIYATSRQRDAVGFAVDADEIATVLNSIVDPATSDSIDTGPCP